LLQEITADLYREWAAAAGVPLTKAIEEVDSLLEAARKAYMP